MTVILKSNLPFPIFKRGKVRDVYAINDDLLIVCTDRISAFDQVLPCGIPEKGKVLNQITSFWFGKTESIIPNHVISTVDSLDTLAQYYPSELPSYLIGRSMVVSKAKGIPVECIVRGYISGSAWKEYCEKGTVNDVVMPKGLRESEKLPEPIFTPTTKAEEGHDLPITDDDVSKLADYVKGTGFSPTDLLKTLEEKSIQIYNFAQEIANNKGIIIADTKFEFGIIDNQVSLIDEVLTPDSSRFWDIKKYEVGIPQPSFDKQPVRDWLASSGWNKQPPAPMLPEEIIQQTSERYKNAYKILTGKDIVIPE